ncbi:myosin heavy chain, fast skeletal muscle isoform X3 [Colias croceus]|uniref:myosin heavy chain, fast skeletal muscle isoform X3 n=1 Tax=Colias crocea TaxID=72248 RepID=UPI001E27AADF|nr:myosin heavy chain, fast skeletal muscle isoform X3 [Colias croceus]
MELQALLVLCGVGVAGVAVLLLMGLFSASGTSYEEAIAQQRKATSELLALAENKSKNKKTNKKANKKLAKKEKNKENTTAATGSEPESEAPAESGVEDEPVSVKPHVEFSPPVVVEVPTEPPLNIKIRKRGKDSKVKPILVNKEDPSCVSDPSTLPDTTVTTAVNHFEEMQPKDEFELLHSTLSGDKATEPKEEVVEKKEIKENKPKQAKGGAKVQPKPVVEAVKEEASRERRNSGEAPKEQRKAKKVEKKAVEEGTVAEEIVPPLNAPQPSELTTEKLLKQALVAAPPAVPAPSPPAKGKKKKAEPNVLSLMAGDSGGVSVSELVRVVKEASLSRTEIQILTDALLNKQHDPLPEHSEWTEGPNDPMQKLKKQLADKEKALADEIEASQALHAKLKELRGLLNAERGRAAAASRAAEQAAAAARAELHTLQTRLQRLMDDNHALAQDKLVLQAKLGEEGEAQAQRVQMEMHIQRLSEAEATLVQQLTALQAELNARVLEAGQARCEAGAARDSMMMAQQHAADLAQQLQEANRLYAELEQQRQCAVHADQLAQQDLRQAQQRLADLQNEVQRATARAQTAESSLDKVKEDYEKQKEELSKEVASLREQLAARESELAEIKMMKVTPAQNGLPVNDANEQQKAAELAKVESVVEALRRELSSAQADNQQQKEQLAQVLQQLEHYKEKNNEAKTRAEETNYNEVINVLRAVCPSAVPANSTGSEWIKVFADNIKIELQKKEAEKASFEKSLKEKLLEKENEKKQLESEMQKKLLQKENERKKLEGEVQKKLQETEVVRKQLAESSQKAPADSRLGELAAQNEQLQALVDKYKRIIDDTEGVLSRLQQNVAIEESRWAQQLADKQKELDDLRHRTVSQDPVAFAYSCIEKSLPSIVEEMQNKIDQLQSELQKAQKTKSHNVTFAEAERLTEEKLISSLSDKHEIDVHNGPLKASLGEK